MKNNLIFCGALFAIIAFSAQGAYGQWTPDPFCPYPSDHVTRYPYYGNCSLYWECYEGAKYVMECPEGLEFNAPLQQCDAPEIAHCDPFASTTSNPNPPTYTTDGTTGTWTPDPLCPYPSDDIVYFPIPGDCTRYWECFEGNRFTYTCPAGLWWHQEISECDYPGDFCDGRTGTPTEGTTRKTTEQPTVSTSTPPNTEPTTTNSDIVTHDPLCPFPSDEIVFFPVPGDCTKYYECFEGKKYTRDCPKGLWWHQEITDCDYPGDFCDGSTKTSTERTTSRTTEQPTVPTSTTPEPTTSKDDIITHDPLCPFPSNEIVFFPVPGDCTKYYECFEGKKYTRDCPKGLWWHQEITDCDYPGSYCKQ